MTTLIKIAIPCMHVILSLVEHALALRHLYLYSDSRCGHDLCYDIFWYWVSYTLSHYILLLEHKRHWCAFKYIIHCMVRFSAQASIGGFLCICQCTYEPVIDLAAVYSVCNCSWGLMEHQDISSFAAFILILADIWRSQKGGRSCFSNILVSSSHLQFWKSFFLLCRH